MVDEQAGFTAGKSSIDNIYTIQLLETNVVKNREVGLLFSTKNTILESMQKNANIRKPDKNIQASYL